MNKTWKIALGQLSIADGNKEANLIKIEEALKQASSASADLLVLPELMLSGLVSQEQLVAAAEPREGESFRRVQEMVKSYPVGLVYSFPEYVSEEEIYITTCFMNHEGQALAYYRKTHLFTDESKLFSRGSEWVKVDLGDLTIGFLTCYDIEFPEPARALALQRVNLLVVNSANMAPYEYIHRLFIRARALENQCFVVYCNRLGANEVYEYHGQSAVIGPDGKLIAEIEEDMEMVRIVDLSLEALEKSKTVFNYLADRRTELYK
jgi:5-aminopentanamidase